MLVRLPYSGDWVDPDLIVGVRTCVAPEQNGYQLHILSLSGGETVLFSAVLFSDLDTANKARDEVAELINFKIALLDAEDELAEDDDTPMRH